MPAGGSCLTALRIVPRICAFCVLMYSGLPALSIAFQRILRVLRILCRSASRRMPGEAPVDPFRGPCQNGAPLHRGTSCGRHRQGHHGAHRQHTAGRAAPLDATAGGPRVRQAGESQPQRKREGPRRVGHPGGRRAAGGIGAGRRGGGGQRGERGHFAGDAGGGTGVSCGGGDAGERAGGAPPGAGAAGGGGAAHGPGGGDGGRARGGAPPGGGRRLVPSGPIREPHDGSRAPRDHGAGDSGGDGRRGGRLRGGRRDRGHDHGRWRGAEGGAAVGACGRGGAPEARRC